MFLCIEVLDCIHCEIKRFDVLDSGGGGRHGGPGVYLDRALHGWLLWLRRQPGLQLAPPPHGHLPRLPLRQWHPRVQGGEVGPS